MLNLGNYKNFHAITECLLLFTRLWLLLFDLTFCSLRFFNNFLHTKKESIFARVRNSDHSLISLSGASWCQLSSNPWLVTIRTSHSCKILYSTASADSRKAVVSWATVTGERLYLSTSRFTHGYDVVRHTTN